MTMGVANDALAPIIAACQTELTLPSIQALPTVDRWGCRLNIKLRLHKKRWRRRPLPRRPGAGLHPAAFFVVLDCTGVQRSGKRVRDHFSFFEQAKRRVQILEGAEIIEHRLHHLVDRMA